MMMLIHSICMALRGFGRPKRVQSAIRLRAAMLLFLLFAQNWRMVVVVMACLPLPLSMATLQKCIKGLVQ